MKKFFLTGIFISLSLMIFAQDESAKPFKPSKGNFSVEVNFKPFGTEAPIGIDGFRGRYFFSEKIALRTGFNIAYKNKNSETPDTYNGQVYYSSAKEKYTVLGLTTGVEYHFLKSARFSPYVGFIAGYENKTSSSEYEDISGSSYSGVTIDKSSYENAWRQMTLFQSSGGYLYYVSGLTERGYSKISVNGVLGADFYVFRNFYMGLELGLGYNTIFYKEATVESDGEVTIKYPKATEGNFGLNLNNAIRVGFWF